MGRHAQMVYNTKEIKMQQKFNPIIISITFLLVLKDRDITVTAYREVFVSNRETV